MEKTKPQLKETNLAESLEKILKCQAEVFASKIADLNEQRRLSFAPFQEQINQQMEEIASLETSNRYFSDILGRLQEVTDHFVRGQQDYQQFLRQMQESEQAAFGEYKAIVETTLAQHLMTSAVQLADRNRALAERSSSQQQGNIELLRKEYEDLRAMGEQIAALGSKNPVKVAYDTRLFELNGKIESLESRRAKSTDPLYFPVCIMSWQRGTKIEYPVVEGHAKLFEDALRSVLKEIGRPNPNINTNRQVRLIMTGNIDGNLGDMLEKELAKKQYEGLRTANLVPVYLAVPSSSKQILETHRTCEKEKAETQKPLKSKEAAEKLGISYGVLKNILYMERRELLEHTYKEGLFRYIKPEGMEALRQYFASRGRPKPASGSAPKKKKAGKLERAVQMHFDGATNREIAKKLRVHETTAGSLLLRAGILTPIRVVKQYGTLAAVKNAEFPGVPKFEKQKIRNEMLELMIEALSNPEPIRYLGLEGPNFSSYIGLSELATIDPLKSLVAENDPRAYNMMHSIVRHCGKIKGGEVFDNLNLHKGDLSRAFGAHTGMKFNFVNLDYMGYLSPEKVETLDKLFANDMLEDEAVLFITLSNSNLDKKRMQHKSAQFPAKFRANVGKYIEDGDQAAMVRTYMAMVSKYYMVTELRTEEYKSRKTPMLFMAFKVERR